MDLISGASSEGAGRRLGKKDGKEGEGEKEEQEMVTIRKDGVLVRVPAMSRAERKRSKS
jgi:hypothetical protein